MAYFPLYIDIGQKKCVVVGGGQVAAGKIRQLSSFGAAVTVVAPAVCEEVRSAIARSATFRTEISLQMRTFLPEDIDGAALVVAAADDAAVNREVSACCKAAGILVNVVDEKELCSFYFPAIVRRGDVVVGMSTGGNSPALAARIRRELERSLPEDVGRAAEWLGKFREQVKQQVQGIPARKRVFERLLDLVWARGELSADEVNDVIAEETRGGQQ